MLACGVGLGDVVTRLVRYGLDASHVDNKGRGALQLAKGSGGKFGNLKEWLLANATDSRWRPLRMTYGVGRDDDSKCSGRVGKLFRKMPQYDWKGEDEGGKGKGYKPTSSSSSSGRW